MAENLESALSLKPQIKELWENGRSVLVTSFHKAYELSEFVGLFTNNHINLVYKADQLIELFERQQYQTLEPLARVFNDCTRIFIYPSASGDIPKEFHKNPDAPLFTLSDYKPSEKNALLFEHLTKAKYVREISDFKIH